MKPLFASTFLISSAIPVSAATLYQQNFETGTDSNPVPGSPNSPLSLVAWDGYTGNGSSITNDTPDNSSASRIGALRGSGGPNGSTVGENAYIFAQNGTTATTGTDFFFFTSTAVTGSTFSAFTPANFTSLTATWARNATNFSSGGYHFSVLVDGQWYATTSNHRLAGNVPPINLLSLSWQPVTTSGSLSMGTGTALTSNDLFGTGLSVTGVGFYVDDLPVPTSSTITLRIDDLLIEGVPEPSTSLLGLIGFSALAFRRKK